MDIEQLTLILNAVQAAGEGAFSLALLWFGLTFVKLVLHYGLWFAALWVFGKRLWQIFWANTFYNEVHEIVNANMETDTSAGWNRREKFMAWLGENFPKDFKWT